MNIKLGWNMNISMVRVNVGTLIGFENFWLLWCVLDIFIISLVYILLIQWWVKFLLKCLMQDR